jgi:hypothetical protein
MAAIIEAPNNRNATLPPVREATDETLTKTIRVHPVPCTSHPKTR